MSSALTVAVTASTALACTALMTALSLIPATHDVRSIADAAALAAADSQLWQSVTSPCDAAETVARSQGTTLSHCACDVSSCTVTTSRTLYGFDLSVTSRAGCESDNFGQACVW